MMHRKILATTGRNSWDGLLSIARERSIHVLMYLQKYLDDPKHWPATDNPVFLTGANEYMRTRVCTLFTHQLLQDLNEPLTVANYTAGAFARYFGIEAGGKINNRLKKAALQDVFILREVGKLAGQEAALWRLHTIINDRRARGGLLTLITGKGTREEADQFHERISSRLTWGLGGSITNL